MEEAPHVRTPDGRIHNGETDIHRLGLGGLGCHHGCWWLGGRNNHGRTLSASVGKGNRSGCGTRSTLGLGYPSRGCLDRSRRRQQPLRTVRTDTTARGRRRPTAAWCSDHTPFATVTHPRSIRRGGFVVSN
jgi:hypothetical protein